MATGLALRAHTALSGLADKVRYSTIAPIREALEKLQVYETHGDIPEVLRYKSEAAMLHELMDSLSPRDQLIWRLRLRQRGLE